MYRRRIAQWAAAVAVAALVLVTAAPPAAALPLDGGEGPVLSALWSKVTAWISVAWSRAPWGGAAKRGSGWDPDGSPGVTAKHGSDWDPDGSPGEESDPEPGVTEKHGSTSDPNG